MKRFKIALSSIAAIAVVGAWAAPLAGAALLMAAPAAYAQPGCTYHVGPPGQGDWIECPNDVHPTPAPPPEPDVFGAIAATPNGAKWGTSWNYRTEAAAGAAALQSCIKDAGPNGGCRILKTVADVCLALVSSTPDRMTFVGGPVGASNFAVGTAQLQCSRAGGRACRIETTVCADGQQHQLQGETVFHNGNPVFTPQGGSAFGRR